MNNNFKSGVDYIGIGVGAAITRGDGKYLLVKRGAKSRNEKGKWGFPGGGIEFGETLEEALKREIKEELNIELSFLHQLPAIDHIIPEENQHWVTNGFVVKIKSGKPKIMEKGKIEKLEWFSLEEMEKVDLTIPAKMHLKMLKKLV